MNNRFVIVIGSQRAGTTLLHRLLTESTSIFMHPVKELHYFDTLHGIRPESALRSFSLNQLKRELDTIIRANDHSFISDSYKCMLRANKLLAFREIGSLQYSDLYRPMLTKRRMLGEATPEYMLLTREQAKEMSTVIGNNAVIILLCRDPVDRIISAAKLFNVYNNAGMNNEQLADWLQIRINENDSWMLHQDMYNDYQSAIARFSGIFPRFTAVSLERLIADPEAHARSLQEILQTTLDIESFVNGTKMASNRLGNQQIVRTELLEQLKTRYSMSRKFLDDYFATPSPP